VIRYELTKEFNEKEFSHNDFKDKSLWKQLLYEFLFEALGYSKNKIIMLKLAQNVDIKFLSALNNDDDLLLKIESILYKVSGLMPETNSSVVLAQSYLEKLNTNWKIIADY